MIKYLPILMILLTACGDKEEVQEAVDLEDFMGDVGVIEDDDTLEENLGMNFNMPYSELASRMIIDYDTLAQNNFHPLDRFNYSTSSKLQFKGKTEVEYGSNMVTPVADFFYYSFADTNKTINAFYNYLDGLAEDGEGGPVKLLEDVEAIKSPPMFMVVYDTIIVSAKYLCEHEENDWDSFQDSILSIYGKEYRYQIDIECGGPLSWK